MKKSPIIIVSVSALILILFLIYQNFFIPEQPTNEMKIKSVFQPSTRIPDKYTCNGENINPSLEISEIPNNTKTLAIIVDDPDAPSKVWVHWLIWNLPAKIPLTKIKESELAGIEGINDFKEIGYIGPCPPKDSGDHRYFFKVYALNSQIELKQGATKEQLEKAMNGHIVDKTELIGLYSRE